MLSLNLASILVEGLKKNVHEDVKMTSCCIRLIYNGSLYSHVFVYRRDDQKVFLWNCGG